DYAMPGLIWKSCAITNPVKNGEILDIEGIKLQIRTAPGHCPGSIIAYLSDIETAITGDVIFNGSIGRTDLPGGSFDVLQENIRKQVYSLPDNTILCPGHGEKTSVEKEKKTNPFVREAG
ncbi:MAG: MBL fold metallo-hydrolase, partial [Spirochaetaceae bacterium]|nr:MBL fold metallo-hydrolase [Spirochaetaceae bacterium]